MQDKEQLAQFSAEENSRESKAQQNGNHYYPLTAFQDIWIKYSWEKLMVQHKQTYIEGLHKKMNSGSRA